MKSRRILLQCQGLDTYLLRTRRGYLLCLDVRRENARLAASWQVGCRYRTKLRFDSRELR